MHADAELALPYPPQSRKALAECGKGVSSVDASCRFVTRGLQAKLHRKDGLLGQFPEQGKHLLGQAVGTRGDIQSNDPLLTKCLSVQAAQNVGRCIRIGVRLEIRDASGGIPFFGENLLLHADLLLDRKRGAWRKIAAPAIRAVDAASPAAASVDVRAGQSCIQGKLCTLSAKAFSQIVIVGIIPLVAVAVRKRIALCLRHRLLPSVIPVKKRRTLRLPCGSPP